MTKLRLNLCSLGDPRDPKTWSGTPLNLVSAIERRDQFGLAFDAEPSPIFRKLLSAVSVPIFGKKDVRRGPIRRYACSLRAARMTSRSVTQHTLHTTSLTLPFLRIPRNQSHYLFCDSTWKLWSGQSADMDEYSQRMIRIFDQLESHAYSQFRHIFSISEYVKENLVSQYGIPADNVTVVGTGLGIIKPYDGRKDYPNGKILFVAKGRFEDKGGEAVISAFRKARRVNPNLKMTIVGSQQAFRYANEENLTVLGFLPIEELQELFNSHSLFLMPAHNEPWGLVYLEAMACQMPIIGLRRNAFPELSGNGERGVIIEDAHSTTLARTLNSLFQAPETLRIMGQRGRAYCASHVSWDKTVDRILRQIERIES